MSAPSTQSVKKVKTELCSQELICNNVIQQLIIIHNSFNEKVKYLEAKFDSFVTNVKEVLAGNLVGGNKTHCCQEVMEKLTGIELLIQSVSKKIGKEDNLVGDLPVVLMPKFNPQSSRAQREGSSNVQVITLNTEDDYPNGSWLGNEKNPETRVRVPITPSQLTHLNTTCLTPEKMAIVLLDYLFTQETLAESNLSGKGKHFKKQLDPQKIYGIKVHLMHRFNITEQDWYRIKQNIDSKCRTAWRKKAMGLPLSRNKGTKQLIKEESSCEEQSEKIIKSNSIVLTGPFISEDNSQELSSMIIEDTDCLTLTGCGEQTLTIITEAGEVNVPILSAEDSLSDNHSSTDEILGYS